MAELFSNFEVNRDARWHVLTALLAGSMALHLVFGASVVLIPTFRDALNIAALVGRTEYADKAYSKTVIGEDIQIVEVGPKFRYPDGYFTTDFSVPLPTATPDPLAPKIISTFVPPKAVTTPTPSPSPAVASVTGKGDGSGVAGSAGKSPTPAPSASGSPNAKTADVKAEDDDEVLGVKENEFNTRPLKDWLARANALKEKGLLDLTADLEMTIDARLNPECRLDDPKVVQKSGDGQMMDLAKELASAISDSRMLLFLKDPEKVKSERLATSLKCDPMALRFTVKLDQSDFDATVGTEAESPDRAAQLTRLYNWALVGGQIKKAGKDEEVIFKNTKVTAEGKQITVHFKIPRADASELLKKQIEIKPAS